MDKIKESFEANNFFLNIKSKYILHQILDNVKKINLFKIIRYNKNIQNRLKITKEDYKNIV